MDSIDFDNVKAEKAKALRRYNRFRRIGSLFRAAEICVALVIVCWTFTCLPFVLKISGEFLRRIASVVSTPLFVFLLGNSIVVVLLTKSSTSDERKSSSTSGGGGDDDDGESEIYQAFVRSVVNRSKPSDGKDLTDEIVYDDKEMIVTDSNSNLIEEEDANIPVSDHQQHKVYRRSKSDVSTKQSSDMVIRSLQRSETTEKKKKKKKDWNYEEDNLSNEEFQKTIEAFIAKQLMFRRQESLAVVVHNNNNNNNNKD